MSDDCRGQHVNAGPQDCKCPPYKVPWRGVPSEQAKQEADDASAD